MAEYSEAIAAWLNHRAIGHALLARLELAEGEQRVWLGSGILQAGGESWVGLGKWASITNIIEGAGDAATSVMLSLSGVDDEIVAKLKSGTDTICGRPVTIYEQFYHPETRAPLGGPAVVFTAYMDRISASLDAQSRKHSTSLYTEGDFTNRSRASSGMLTVKDRQALYPGEIGLEFTPMLVQKVIKWPSY